MIQIPPSDTLKSSGHEQWDVLYLSILSSHLSSNWEHLRAAGMQDPNCGVVLEERLGQGELESAGSLRSGLCG